MMLHCTKLMLQNYQLISTNQQPLLQLHYIAIPFLYILPQLLELAQLYEIPLFQPTHTLFIPTSHAFKILPFVFLDFFVVLVCVKQGLVYQCFLKLRLQKWTLFIYNCYVLLDVLVLQYDFSVIIEELSLLELELNLFIFHLLDITALFPPADVQAVQSNLSPHVLVFSPQFVDFTPQQNRMFLHIFPSEVFKVVAARLQSFEFLLALFHDPFSICQLFFSNLYFCLAISYRKALGCFFWMGSDVFCKYVMALVVELSEQLFELLLLVTYLL